MPNALSPKSFAGIHEGETGLVIGNGPSLNDVPMDFLMKYPKVACNHYHCACMDLPGYRTLPPSEYWSQLGYNQVMEDEQRRHYYPAIEAARLAFVNKQFADEFPQENVVGILSRKGQNMKLPRPYGNKQFSRDPLYAVGVGFTQTYVSLQIAFWLGFETVLMVGVDGSYKKALDKHGRRHFYPDAEHNSDSPFGGEERFVVGSNYVYRIANEAYEEAGRRIINLTPETTVRALEKGDISEWM